MAAASQRDIERAIQEHGVGGRPVCIHSSFRSLGRVAGGPKTVVEPFLGAGSTILVPTFSWEAFSHPPQDVGAFDRNGVAPDYAAGPGHDRVFDTSSSDIDADMGAIPAHVLTYDGHERGDHPLCSFTALGSDARALVASQSRSDVFAPLRELCEADGAVVLIGVDLTSMTLLHLAEQEAGRRPFVRWALDDSGEVVTVRVGGCSAGFSQLEDLLTSSQGTIGPSVWTVYDAKDTVRAAASAIRHRPSITNCGQPSCVRCTDAIAGGPTPAP